MVISFRRKKKTGPSFSDLSAPSSPSAEANLPKPSKSWPLIEQDPYLETYADFFTTLHELILEREKQLTKGQETLANWATAHEYFGLHLTAEGWVLREWAPNASAIYLIGPFTNWGKDPAFAFAAVGEGVWQIKLPKEALHHQELYRLLIEWPGGSGERIPAYARRVVQDHHTKIFSAQVWAPAEEYLWKVSNYTNPARPLFIYEAHVGMALEEERVGTYWEFKEYIIPRIVAAGYNTIQLMAIAEHPYYGSFGYQVANFFAPSSRFGTPEELKELIDTAHAAGLSVLMDLVHSHSVKNEVEGLSRFDGTLHQYFHNGSRGEHPVWDSRLFDYSKKEVLHFLLSNVRYWLEEFKFDGFRFDGVTSMLYHDHGLGRAFMCYDDYFNEGTDHDALTYLALANKVVHELRPDAITVAEDVSGMPGLAAPISHGGFGFDYRLAMGIPDFWVKNLRHNPDEKWHVEGMFYELTNRRSEEKTISYAESHDQALVGDQTIIFRLLQEHMYDRMRIDQQDYIIDRGMALHRLIRFATLSTAAHGYLNFMGNEFGHPEWIDFPRAGNNWSYHHARRLWSLRDNLELQYHRLAEFDARMLAFAKDYRLYENNGATRIYSHVDLSLIHI